MFQVVLDGRAHCTAEEIHMKTQQDIFPLESPQSGRQFSSELPAYCDGVMLETYSKTHLKHMEASSGLTRRNGSPYVLLSVFGATERRISQTKQNCEAYAFLEGCLAV